MACYEFYETDSSGISVSGRCFGLLHDPHSRFVHFGRDVHDTVELAQQIELAMAAKFDITVVLAMMFIVALQSGRAMFQLLPWPPL